MPVAVIEIDQLKTMQDLQGWCPAACTGRPASGSPSGFSPAASAPRSLLPTPAHSRGTGSAGGSDRTAASSTTSLSQFTGSARLITVFHSPVLLQSTHCTSSSALSPWEWSGFRPSWRSLLPGWHGTESLAPARPFRPGSAAGGGGWAHARGGKVGVGAQARCSSQPPLEDYIVE